MAMTIRRLFTRHTGTAIVGLLILGATGLSPARAQGNAGQVGKRDGVKSDSPVGTAAPRAIPGLPDFSTAHAITPAAMPTTAAPLDAAPDAIATPPQAAAASADVAPSPPAAAPPMAAPLVPAASADPQPTPDPVAATLPAPKETEWVDTSGDTLTAPPSLGKPDVAEASPAVPTPAAPPPAVAALAPPPAADPFAAPPDAAPAPGQVPPLSGLPDLSPPAVAETARKDDLVIITNPSMRDTATIVSGGKEFVLYGIEGRGGDDAATLLNFIIGSGGTLQCRQEETDRKICTLPDGKDIAKVALVNGFARVVIGGPKAYQDEEEAAQQNRRGLWADLPPLAPQVEHPAMPDTATLRGPSGDIYRLDGIVGVPGPMAETLRSYIATHGDSLECQPQGPETFVCVLSDATDIAKLALVNGLAKVAPDASNEYRIEQDDAQANRRGLWAGLPPAAVAAASQDMAKLRVVVAQFDVVDEGFSIVDGQPTLLVEGAPVFMVFAGAAGWGYWDHGHRWHGAPERYATRLDGLHPRGEGLRGWSNPQVRQAMVTARPGEFGRGVAVGGARPGMGGPMVGGMRPGMGGPMIGGVHPGMGGPMVEGMHPGMGGPMVGGMHPGMGGPMVGGMHPGMGGPMVGGARPGMGGPMVGGVHPGMGGPMVGGARPGMGGPMMGGARPGMGAPMMGGARPAMGGPMMGGARPPMMGGGMAPRPVAAPRPAAPAPAAPHRR